ncbi:SH3 domain-containing protein [Pseudanabaena minima]|uniref:SH3 domain-containing protein n=1 Tax=Pseudanabaena minima TaxID=890415 RepID=UPI003DA9461A
MKLTKILSAIIVPLISFAPNFTAIANAQSDTPRAFRGRCVAEILGQEKGSRVNMRSAPGVDSEIVGYVLVGQRVAQLYYSISGYSPIVQKSDREGVSWDYVEYLAQSN